MAAKVSPSDSTRTSPLDRAHAPPIGEAERLAPGVRVVTAPNGGPMTFTGTRSYIVGEGDVAVIDPGPDDPGHATALAAAVEGERVRAVLVTHAHRDHSAGAAAFAARVGAPVLAHGDPRGARSPAVAALGASLGGGEGIDAAFHPDERIGEGSQIAGPGWTLTAIATPGHTADHLSFAWAEGRALFSGDHLMGWATTLISPPDGDLGAFRASVARVLTLGAATLFPGHGAPVSDPAALAAHVLAHRRAREAQLLAALARGPACIPALVAEIYADVDPRLHPAAARNLLAHLIDLMERGEAMPDGPVRTGAVWRLV